MSKKWVTGWDKEKILVVLFNYHVSGSQKRVSGGEYISQLISCIVGESPTALSLVKETADKYFIKNCTHASNERKKEKL